MIRIDHAKVLKYIRANENLSHLFEYYLNTCITQSNPYHNTNHTMAMMYHICCIYEESNRGKYEFVIDEQGLYILLVCAIFHDYNHSAGKFNDNTNVTTFKITAGYHMDEVTSDVVITAFSYDSEDDFKDGFYRGNSSYQIVLKRN